MPYKPKTSKQEILAKAMEQVAQDGIRNLSLRGLAAGLGLAPNALYRYFEDRAALETAISVAGERQLLIALKRAAGTKKPEQALRSMTAAYVRFARENPHLYEIMIAACKTAPEDLAESQKVWVFVVGQVSRLSGEARAQVAATALWALLHGVVTLNAADVFGKEKPYAGLHFGLDAWMEAAGSADRPSPGK